MNQIMRPIINFFRQLDNRTFNRMLMVIISGIILIFGTLLYTQLKAVRRYKREMVSINNERMHIKEILEKNELLKKQQKRAKEILAQNKNFFLTEYIENLAKQLKLNLKAYPITVIDLENLRSQGYEEVRMEAELINLNMKQVVDLLHELEQNNIIDIKRVEITKSKKQPTTIDLALTISTLQQKAEVAEEFETE